MIPLLATGPARRLVGASRVIGSPVFSPRGERCGRVGDLSIDKASGHIDYALLYVENGLGFLRRVSAAPWRLLRHDAALGGYVLPADRAELEKEPRLSDEDLQALGAGDRSWQERLALYYNPYLLAPYC
ncbi:MAG: PRC-barrel domain-containing protein [Caulobacteraceae bacterium]|nr:PRC-barrel domain-containing protein [Caulobacteraceae bacterium]